ncbi:MAG: LysR family transcriptional regulator [Alphaproteobacteria bacterium]|nr:LysR family transcriptional regulator [Alphaproteobacteria bacterium]
MQRLIRHIHSPTALFAFEVAARHLSFTRAANELNVTQPAVIRL